MWVLSIIWAQRTIADDAPCICKDLPRLIAWYLFWRCLWSQIEAPHQATPYDDPYYSGYRPPHHSIFTSLLFNNIQIIIHMHEIIFWAVMRYSAYKRSHIWNRDICWSLFYPLSLFVIEVSIQVFIFIYDKTCLHIFRSKFAQLCVILYMRLTSYNAITHRGCSNVCSIHNSDKLLYPNRI